MSKRTIELILLILASFVVMLMFGAYYINTKTSISVETFAVPLGIICSFLVAHIAIRKLSPAADPAILPIVLILCGTGIVFITRLAPELAIRQVIWLFAGVISMILVLIVVKNLHNVGNYKYTLMIIGIILLASPMFPVIGQEIYGSRIWLSLGPFSFQPGEIAKIVIVLFLAGYLSANREMLSIFTWKLGPFNLPDIRTLMPLLGMWGISVLIVIFEKDLGSALVFFFVFIIMLYVSTGKKSYLVISICLSIVAGFFLYSFFGHVQQRVSIWLDPWSDPTGSGYQLVQSLYSLADGGLTGTGIGNGLSTQIPVVESDFIFIAICEEFGLLGGAAILLLFLSFAIRGFLSASRAKNDIGSFITVGLTSTILLQAFIIVGGVTKLIPLTGITLPFISQGGSSLLAGFIIVGFILRAGDEGTGLENELKASQILLNNGVLGRVSLGKRLTKTLIVFSFMFAILVANLTYIMIIQAEDIKHMSSNNHIMIKEMYNKRGNIETKDGLVLAKSEKNSDGSYNRVYPQKTLCSHLLGYASTRFGTAGIENSWNDTLKGKSSYASWRDVLNSLTGKTNVGNDVVLSINSNVQKSAESAISGKKGACVVIDSSCGAVLACASSPTYDNNDIEGILSGTVKTQDSAIYNRATNLYAPGSTFKMVTLGTALSNNVTTEDDVYSSPGTLNIDGGQVTTYKKYSYGNITLRRATELSSNTVFAQVGEKLGAEKLVDGAKKFGFNTYMDFDIPLSMSLMPQPDEMTLWETAWAAAGEPVGEHNSPAGPQASAVQMALVGCAIANQGTIYAPYLVDSAKNSSGDVGYKAIPRVFSTPISKEVAQREMSVLEGVVKRGTGTAAAISGISVAGKTGTAEKANGLDDSWFVGFANLPDGGSAVVALVLEDSSDAPAQSKKVLETALKVTGKL